MNFTGLLEPQKDHSRKILDSIYVNGVATDLSQTGTGKTYSAGWTAQQLDDPVVVICPKVVCHTWYKTLKLFNITPHLVVNFELLLRGNTPYLKYNLNKFMKTNDWWKTEGLTLKFPKNALIIVDEAHKCRGQKSLGMHLLTALKNYGYKVLCLSATQATSVADMKGFGYLTNLHNGKNFKQWCFDHGAVYNEFGTISWDGTQQVAQEGMQRIHNTIFNVQKLAGRMKRTDFGNIFPDNRVLPEVFDLGSNTAKVQLAYDLMEAELAALEKRAANYSQHVLAAMMKTRRQVELLKVPTMVDWIEDMYDEGISPVVFVNFTDSVQAIVNKLNTKKYKDKIALFTGLQTYHEKNEFLKEFQADKRRIMIANIDAGNMGVSMHDLNGLYPRHSLLSPTWKAINIIQAIGRIHRAYGLSPCIQRLLYANVPIEEKMCDRLQARVDNLDMLNDGDLSYEYCFAA